MTRIEHALSTLRTELVHHFAQADLNDALNHPAPAEQVARTVVACLRIGQGPADSRPHTVYPILASDVLKRTLRYINDNLDSKLTWRNIAATVEMNPLTFGRRCKLTMGMTPHQYVTCARVKRAIKLLIETQLNIAQIAAEVGCSCQSHLTNLLRKYAGTTPRACRTATRQTRRDTTAAGGSPLAALPKEIAGTRATAARIRDSL